MNWYAIFAIYFLIWVISAFIMLPFGIRTPDETGEVLLKGQADSAPSNFRPWVVVLRATLLSALLFGVYYANYVQGWVTLETLPGYHIAR
jgi:predicted secreted protein